jgi:hypothetical protein
MIRQQKLKYFYDSQWTQATDHIGSGKTVEKIIIFGILTEVQ